MVSTFIIMCITFFVDFEHPLVGGTGVSETETNSLLPSFLSERLIKRYFKCTKMTFEKL